MGKACPILGLATGCNNRFGSARPLFLVHKPMYIKMLTIDIYDQNPSAISIALSTSISSGNGFPNQLPGPRATAEEIQRSISCGR